MLLVGLLVVGALSQPANTDGNANVFGSGLQKCDRSAVSDPKYPSTGYMRQNVCTATVRAYTPADPRRCIPPPPHPPRSL